MSEFNLEQFMNGTPAYTRDGRKAQFIYFNEDLCATSQLSVLVQGEKSVFDYTKDGSWYCKAVKSKHDLVRMAGKYDHIKEGDLVMVWNDRALPDDARLRSFVSESSTGKATCKNFSKDDIIDWDNCLTVEEFAEKYLNN